MPPARSVHILNPGSPLVTLDRIDKRFRNGTLALSGVGLAVQQGEFLSLLGPSGCGKSTILRLIAGLSAPTAGSVIWGDRRTHDIGFVFQEPTLMPWSRIIDNVALPLKLAHTPRTQAQDRAREALDRVGLGGFERHYPRELSGGMKMRVSIARALVMRPRVLLMDEPFAALDEITRLTLNDDLLALWQAQRFTAIFVTHSVFESVYLSTRILVMAARPGRVAAEFAVDADYPRQGYRSTSAYTQQCDAVSAALSHAMGGTATL
jgi:NitT/TauT family transport system ATP-binding protein